MGLVSVGLVIDTAGAQVANWAMRDEMTVQSVHWVNATIYPVCSPDFALKAGGVGELGRS